MSSYRGFTDEELKSTLILQQEKIKRLHQSPIEKGFEETRSRRIIAVNSIIAEIKSEISSRK